MVSVVVVVVAVVFLVVDGCGRTTRLVAAGSLAAGHVLDRVLHHKCKESTSGAVAQAVELHLDFAFR